MAGFGKYFIVGVPLLVAGCGLPPAIAAFSYAVDGISYVASGKGVTDHAISAVAEEDCAMFRVVRGEAICRTEDGAPADPPVVVAAAAPPGPSAVTARPAPQVVLAAVPARRARFDYLGINPSQENDWAIDTRVEIVSDTIQIASTEPVSIRDDRQTLISVDQAPVAFDAGRVRARVAEFTNFAPGTEIYGLLQEDGVLEIFAYQPTRLDPTRNLKLIARFENFGRNPGVLEGIRINGQYYRMGDIIV